MRQPLLVCLHSLVFIFAYWLAFELRFDFDVPTHWVSFYVSTLPYAVGIQLACFYFFGTFNGWWRYFTFRDLVSISYPLILGFGLFAAVDLLFFTTHAPRSVHLLDTLIAGILICLLRSTWRLSKEGLWTRKTPSDCKLVLLICNHNDSAILAHQINNRLQGNVRVMGILSDCPKIIGVNRAGMRVLGSPMDAPSIAKAYQTHEVWSVAGDIDGRELNILKQWFDQHSLPLKVIPNSADWGAVNGKIPLREININDLLQRDPIRLDTDLIGGEIEGKRVLVTGAGGSIGSEICRQLVQFQPAELVLVDHRENSVFLIHGELSRMGICDTTLHPAVGDILDRRRLQFLFEHYAPEYVFHAAAHKHVGLMEISSGEAIKNNIQGTQQVADLADKHGVRKFVLVSTDKAVNPTSIMGCTKQIAERYVLSLAQNSSTAFVIVRFGNVLGSNGSVVPIFQEQIARGGPVTLTDSRMTRFFMTIPEASQLVLQAGAMGQGGEIFVLDMGEQVQILELAKTLIRLSGLPENSIEIKTIGMRPGEKLYEELHIDPDQLLETTHPKINAAWESPLSLEEINQQISSLIALAYSPNAEIRKEFKTLITEYKDGYNSSSQTPTSIASKTSKAV